MDETYRAKLSSSPHPHPQPQVHVGEETPPSQDHPNHGDTIHIQPHPHHGGSGGTDRPIPIQLPNIYVHPYPPRERTPPPPPAPPQPAPAPAPAPAMPPVTVNVAAPKESPKGRKIGPFRLTKPHPLLWLSLILSVIALVLEVPKGSLPTLTGRHRALRTQEKLVSEKLALLTKLSTFLPLPLSSLVAPLDPRNPIPTSLLALNDHTQLDLLRLAPHLRFWNTAIGAPYGVGVGDDGRGWWSIEDLGQGASVVRSKDGEREKEVWVLKVGENSEENANNLALSTALTHSLLLRDRLQNEVSTLKATPCPACPAASGGHYHLDTSHGHVHAARDDDDEEAYQAARKEEWERLEERKRRDKERHREVEEREREVARREKWVVEEMRKMSDKIHGQATELTLEDRITERLKSYQRQLSHLKDQKHEEL
ncbi:uncharacterized protein I303_104369 [Kwoniella dejecticola CBS 10117]|uniref:Uncharacterized protein n=1 Tax=Kwoniella dejecticola CBS 10117 TaxID=1296121 RepID=A0A1A6A5J3_9TREE|nr:uncharacterized protein I303_04655 [Kwoniella dejecticola CBS 10117]OBR85320.1 hypothetical protein I303_04655 [Kwoniella dejecticola CBS 10117]